MTRVGIKNKNKINIFIISGFFSIITLSYIGVAYSKNACKSTIPYELIIVFMPLLYGIFGLVNYYVIMNYGLQYSFIVGMIFGLFLSIVGRFKLNLPILIFNFTKKSEYKVHIYATLLYACIFQLIISPITTYLIK